MLTQNEVKDNLYTVLKELGISDHEIGLYTLSLTIGPAPIALLAEKLGMPRPNVYKLIASLEEHGLARFSQRKKYARTFVVEQPSILLKKLREKKESISQLANSVTSLMPDLYGLYHQGELPTKVKVLQNESEYIEAVDDILNEVEKEIYFFGSFDDFIRTVTPEGFRKFTKLRLERKILSKTLVLPTDYFEELKKTEETDDREIRILKNSLLFNTSFQLSKHKVIIWQPISPLALLVEDQYIVAMLRAMFEVLWNVSK